MIKRWRAYEYAGVLHLADQSVKWTPEGRLINDRLIATQREMDKWCIIATRMQLEVCQCHLNRRGHPRTDRS